MKGNGVFFGVTAAVVVLVVSAALAWGASPHIGLPDATAVARGGVDALDAPERSAGAAFAPGFTCTTSLGSLYTGTGLVASRVRLEWASRERAASWSWAQLASPVHRATECALVLRGRRRAWIAGVGASITHFDFDAVGEVVRHVGVQGGLGWHPSARVAVVNAAHFETRARAPLETQWIAAAKWEFASNAFLYVQRERRADAPARSGFGLGVESNGFEWSAGYDASARAHTLGGTWNLSSRLQCAWGARTHPELGWSHAWTCVLRLDSASR